MAESAPSVSAAVESLDPVRRSWYERCVARGDSPAEALAKARAHTPAREIVRNNLSYFFGERTRRA